MLLSYLEAAAPVEPLPAEEQAELDELAALSDDALWTTARAQMAADLQDRTQSLMSRHSRGELSKAEVAELALLVERGDRLMLRKAEAGALLTRREK